MTVSTVPQFLLDKGITQIVALDYETFYSTHFTLSKMSTSLYIFDEQFKVHGVGINSEGKTKYHANPLSVMAALALIDWSKTAILCHHTQFDALSCCTTTDINQRIT